MVKINTDAAWKLDSIKEGLGFATHKELFVLLFAGSKSVHSNQSVEIAELRAVLLERLAVVHFGNLLHTVAPLGRDVDICFHLAPR